MKSLLATCGLLAAAVLAAPAMAETAPSPPPADATVYFIEPADGATVASPFTVKFGLKGMGVAPAGTDAPGTGHHHLLIDLTETPPMGQPMPVTEQIHHFGKGQTETEVVLPSGQHTLQLMVGDKAHVPLLKSNKITVYVE